ncbi:MAG: Zn-ribbon domain-containing OB-fold protein [Pseudomonadota bacterium]
MTATPEKTIIFEKDQHITARGRYYAGRVGSAFFTALRDEGKIYGVKCRTCDKVYWPPRSTCGRCFSQLNLDDLVEIGPEGTVETFTLVEYAEPCHPRPAPFIYAVVKLDGADSGLAHFLGEVEFKDVREGLRVRAVFAENRRADILDIQYFKPL